MDSKQFAWAYLIKNGKAEVSHSFYGGWTPIGSDWKLKYGSHYDHESYERARQDAISRIKTIGVDWSKTKAPESNLVSEFNGTFNDPSTKEIIEGKMILNDGSIINWVGDAIEVTYVFDMMANVHAIEEEFEYLK